MSRRVALVLAALVAGGVLALAPSRAEAADPPRFSVRAVVALRPFTDAGDFGRAAALWGYGAGSALGAGFYDELHGGALLFDAAPWPWLALGARVGHQWARAGVAWFDRAPLSLALTHLAPQAELRLRFFARGAWSLRWTARGAVGLALGASSLRGEAHLGAGYHGSVGTGFALRVGPAVCTLEGGYQWNTWDSGGAPAMSLNSPEFSLGLGAEW